MREFLRRSFELSRGGAHNVHPMEGMRGFAVSLVFLVHYVGLIAPWISGSLLLEFASAIHAIGTVGVDLFFVLSGYLIYGSLISRPQRFFRFMSRRIERIYPAFIAVFALYVILSFVFPKESKIPSPISNGLFYLAQNFLLLPGIFPIQPMITVSWSLSYEMFFYLAIPLVIVMFRLRNVSRIWRVSFFCAVALAMIVLCSIHGGPSRLVMFISGILLFEALESPRAPKLNSIVGLVALVVGLCSTLLPQQGSIGSIVKISVLFASFFLLCMSCFQDSSREVSRAFAWTPLRWLGNMSYSYYLIHGLALKGAFLVLPFLLPKSSNFGEGLFWGLMPVMFVWTLLPSALLFLLVERPFSLATMTPPPDLKRTVVETSRHSDLDSGVSRSVG